MSTLPMYYDERFKKDMMETDTVVGSSIRVTVDRDGLAAGLQLVSRAASSRGTVQVLGGAGSFSITSISVSIAVSAANGGRPVSSS